MTPSLDPSHNPILRVYELFREPGVAVKDGANFLGVENLPLATFGVQASRELILFLRQTAARDLETCRLTLGGRSLINFASGSIMNWFEWDSIDDFARQGLLNENASAIFSEWRMRIEQYELDHYWSGDRDPVIDSLDILEELSACENQDQHFTLETNLRKTGLVKEFLLGDRPESDHDVSGLVWHSPASMVRAFADFKELLEYISSAAKHPVILFFFEPIETYTGDWFKILPLSGSAETRAQREEELVRQLSAVTPQVLGACAELRTRYIYESRPGVGERFYLPTALFLRQQGLLSSYPAHPLFSEGTLRSLVIYSLLAWLAERTESQQDTTLFYLPSTEKPLSLAFSPTDIRQNNSSLLGDGVDWQNAVMRLAHDVTDSTGSRSLRELWSQAMQSRSPASFTAANFFTTLNAVHDKFTGLVRAPLQISGRAPDLELRVFLKKKANGESEIDFELHSESRLSFFHEDAGSTPLAEYDPQSRLADLKELARYHLTRLLEPDEESATPLPDVNRLETRGRELWVKLIPDHLKRDYASFRNQKDLAILIVSTDPSFPWELVKPSEIKGSGIAPEGFKDMWWALQFGIARWLAGRRPPADEIEFKRVCCIAATHSQLSSADKELEYLRGLGIMIDEPKTRADLLKQLRTEDYDVIHFACHGNFDQDQPNESVIQLPDRSQLAPADLYDADIEERMNKKRPLVFINSCHSGRAGPAITGLGGWAERFIEMGCGAFIGCGWEVADPLAAEFAIGFYKRLRHKEPLGQAVQLTREQIRKTNPKNSTWLAYFLYGNPYCHLKM